MNHFEINHQRLINQGIAENDVATPGEVVSRLVGIQAQDFASAKWAIGLRLPGSVDGDIERAIAGRTIIRTWPMRGTLHFVAANDVRWLLALLAPRIKQQTAGQYRRLELDEATLTKSVDIVARTLAGYKQLTRDELSPALTDAGIAAVGQRLSHILHRAALERIICLGPRRGKRFTYTLLDEWVPAAPVINGEEALHVLALRYFASRGPATVADFAYWSGMSMAHARVGLELAKPTLCSIIVDTQHFWLPESASIAKKRPATGYALPGFDEYLLGYEDRSATLHPDHASKVVPGGNGIFNPTIVIDGVTVGTWRRTVKKGTLEIVAQPFDKMNAAEHDLFAAAAMRYAKFMGMAAMLEHKTPPSTDD